MKVESLLTRVESFVDMIKRKKMKIAADLQKKLSLGAEKT